jgi:hypothetical protein
MSISARNWAWDTGKYQTIDGDFKDLQSGQKFTLVCLGELENIDKGYAYPSEQYLSERMKVDVRTVRRHIAFLKAAGIITVKKVRVSGQRFGNNTYYLNVPEHLRRKDQGWMAARRQDMATSGELGIAKMRLG